MFKNTSHMKHVLMDKSGLLILWLNKGLRKWLQQRPRIVTKNIFGYSLVYCFAERHT